LNRIAESVDLTMAANHLLSGRKNRCPMEQKGAVAALSQLRTIYAPALPRSNQNEATLFD
jgi:hypothetical protein